VSILAALQVSRLANQLRFYSHLLVTLTAALVTHDCVRHSEDKKQTRSKSVDNHGKGRVFFKFYTSVVPMTILQAINGDQQTNELPSEMYLRA
jgi:hypothetical protein